MHKKIHQLFDEIKAEDELKNSTFQTIIASQKPNKQQYFSKKLAITMISIFLFITTGTISYQVYQTPSTFIDMDINPSIELTLNRFHKVIQVHSYNEDGEKLLASTNLKHKSYEDALSMLIDLLDENGFLIDNGLLSVTVQSSNRKDSLLLSIQESIQHTLNTYPAILEQEIFPVDEETKVHSHTLNISPAKYLAILELQEADPSVTVDECRNHSIKELRKCAHEHKGHFHNNAGNDCDIRHSSGANRKKHKCDK